MKGGRNTSKEKNQGGVSRRDFLKVSALAALMAACGRTVDNLESLDPGVSPTAEAKTTEAAAPIAIPEFYSDYLTVFNTQTNMWERQNPAGVPVAQQTAESEWQIDYAELAKDERINVFDANTFPKEYKDIANNWLEYAKTHTNSETDAQWEDYQKFVEATRQEFFEQKGIADEVADIKDINPNLKSLWGMIYWTQMNLEKVRIDKIITLVTPAELKLILENEEGSELWEERVFSPSQNREITNINGSTGYPRELKAGLTEWNNPDLGGKILGRIDVQRLMGPFGFDILGDFALIARVLPNDPEAVLAIMQVKAASGSAGYRHRLYSEVVPLDPSFILPVGSICDLGKVGDPESPRPLPEAIAYGQILQERFGAVLDKLFQLLGKHVIFKGFYFPRLTNGYGVNGCVDPKTGLDLIGDIIEFGDTDRAWEWQESTSP